MPNNNFTLRQQKYGDKRFEIMTSFLKELEGKKINSISVEEVCQKVKISKVTFFKYFTSKEEVLYYYIHMWQYKLSYTIAKQIFSGKEGIKNIFDTVATKKYAINFMHAIIQYLIKLEEPIQPMIISEYEYYLFCKEAYRANIKKLDLEEVFYHYLRDISLENIDATFESLISAFYGVPLAAHLMGNENRLSDLYQNIIRQILG